MPDQNYTLLAIDDHPLIRKGGSDLIDMDPCLELIGEDGLVLAKALREDDRLENQSSMPDLTARENEILQQIAQGLGNRQIANNLKISEGTVKVHVKHLLKKFKLHSRTEAAVWALNREHETSR
jgi:DNA-binding NarL/FixJ family response regulator